MLRKRGKLESETSDPWNDETFVVHGHATNLRTMRMMAQDAVDRDLTGRRRSSVEGGMGHSIVALCEEIDRLHEMLEEADG